MSVDLYSGTPGSGKSLNVTRKILLNLWAGRDVISNYPIKFTKREIRKGYADRFFYADEDFINVFNLVKFAKMRGYLKNRRESQCLVVIDEAGVRFNDKTDKEEKRALEEFFSSDSDASVSVKVYGKKDRQQWVKFFSQHRKFGFDFILVAQSDRMIDRQIRNMVEKEYIHRKMSNMVWWFRLLPVKFFVIIEKYYGLSMKTDTEFMIFRRSIANRYDSMKLFDGYDFSIDSDLSDCRAIFKPPDKPAIDL